MRTRPWPRSALEEIAQVYLIPADFRETGRVIVVAEQLSPLAGLTGSDQLEKVLRLNLGGFGPAAAALANPVDRIEELSLAPLEGAEHGPQSEAEEMADFLIPFGVMFILFFVITMSAGYMLQSVSREKENRTAELLLTSLSPRELDAGQGGWPGRRGAGADGHLAGRGSVPAGRRRGGHRGPDGQGACRRRSSPGRFSFSSSATSSTQPRWVRSARSRPPSARAPNSPSSCCCR